MRIGPLGVNSHRLLSAASASLASGRHVLAHHPDFVGMQLDRQIAFLNGLEAPAACRAHPAGCR